MPNSEKILKEAHQEIVAGKALMSQMFRFGVRPDDIRIEAIENDLLKQVKIAEQVVPSVVKGTRKFVDTLIAEIGGIDEFFNK